MPWTTVAGWILVIAVFGGPVTSWHQHNPRSRKGTAAKLDLQQPRGSNKLMIKENTSAYHANDGGQWILCRAGSALWTADQHSYSSDYLLHFLQHARATHTLPRAQLSTCYQPVLLTHPLGVCQIKLFSLHLCLWSQLVLSHASLCFLSKRRLLHTWWVLGDLPLCDEPVHLECVAAEAAKEPGNHNFTTVFGDPTSFRAKGLRPEPGNLSCERVSTGTRKSFVRKGCDGNPEITILPQFLAIEPHFVRKGCISWRLVGTCWHCPAPSREK